MVKVVHEVGGYHTIMGAARELGTTFWAVYGHIKRNQVPTIRVGKTLMVKLSDLNGMR